MRNRWRIDFAQPLEVALSEWEGQAAVGRRPKTVDYNKRVCRILRTRWDWELATPCEAITAASVTRFAQSVSHYSPSQFNHLVNTVRAIVPAAVFLRRKMERPKIALLPDDKGWRQFLHELDNGRSAHAGLVARLLALTGLRIGEACALTKRDVLENGLLVKDSKTGRPRLVPWVGECRQIVERLKVAAKDSPRLVNVKSIKTALDRACMRAEIARLCHHDFRRIFATRCIESGVDIPTVARWLGHSDGGALLGRTYFHLADKHSQRMAGQVAIAV